jgi:predicted RNase H-like HicB family nuclease
MELFGVLSKGKSKVGAVTEPRETVQLVLEEYESDHVHQPL